MKTSRTAAERLKSLLADPEFARQFSLPDPHVPSQALYTRLLSAYVAPLMRQHEYKRRRNCWGRQTSDGWVVVDFQACSFSSRHELRFTVNLGCFSHEVAKALHEKDYPSTPPPQYLCHYSERIGFLMKPGRDLWWTVRADRSIDQLGARIGRILERFALPHLDMLSSDELLLRRMLNSTESSSPVPRATLALLARLRPSSDLRAYAETLYQSDPNWTRNVWEEMGLPISLLPVEQKPAKRRTKR